MSVSYWQKKKTQNKQNKQRILQIALLNNKYHDNIINVKYLAKNNCLVKTVYHDSPITN